MTTLSGEEANGRAAFAPDGSFLVTGGGGSPVVWDTSSGKVRYTLDVHGPIGGVAVSPDGGLIAIGSCRTTSRGVTVWDATSGARVRALAAPGTPDLEFSPDGTLLAAISCDGVVRLWKVPSFELVRRISTRGSGIQTVDFSPDGMRLATSSFSRTAKVWDVATGDRVLSLVGHDGLVSDVKFSPAGRFLATAGADNTARLGDASTGREVLRLTGSKLGMTSLAFSPDGTRLAVSTKDGTVRIYVLPIAQLVDLARARLTRSWTSAECRQYLHQQSCPNE